MKLRPPRRLLLLLPIFQARIPPCLHVFKEKERSVIIEKVLITPNRFSCLPPSSLLEFYFFVKLTIGTSREGIALKVSPSYIHWEEDKKR